MRRVPETLRKHIPTAGLIGAIGITVAWWALVAHGLWLAYNWVSV